MKARANKEQIKSRVAELARIMLDGTMNLDIEQFVREREKDPKSLWFVGECEQPMHYATIRRYIGKAEKLIAADCKEDRPKLIQWHIAKRRRLYAGAVRQGDNRAALAILDSEARLLGLFPTPDEGKGSHERHTTINVFERAVILSQQLNPRALDGPIPSGALLGDDSRECLDQTHADAETAGVPTVS